MENKRRDFLKTACAPVVFSMFGITMLEACSKGDDDDLAVDTANNGSDGPSDGSSISIDLNSSDFSDISEIGGWMNYTGGKMLLLRISETEIRAFSNVCPHAGANNQWSHDNSKFVCGNHNRSFNDDCSGSGLKMTCYTATIDGNILNVMR
jgi:nitrite reductase/ring-hydroxylating ferredoxin subunit